MRTQLIGKNDDNIINIFINRGINPDKIFRLNDSALHDPLLIKNLKEVAEIIHDKIVNSKDKILLIQDPDADGYTSTAIIYNYLKNCYKEEITNRIIIIFQENKEHGIPVKTVEDIMGEHNVDLIIAPDCSSNEYDVHKYILEKLNIPIVILDHHDAPKFSEYATMVNISLDDYPNKKLSGAGVCLKFAALYDKMYGFDHSEKYYDLAAIGIVGDMIEINTLETIYIVQQGMRNIHNTFLKALYKAKSFNLGGQVTPIGLSFSIVPMINAVTRVGTMDEKKEVTKAMVSDKPYDVPSTKRGAKEGDTEVFHEAVVRKMNNIKARQDRLRDNAFNSLETQIEENKLTDNQILILDTKNEFPKTFTGLIANQFVSKYKKPTLVGTYFEKDGKTFFGGSARGDDKSDLPELKRFEQESGLFEFAEGHEGAHGFAFAADKKDEIVEYFNKQLSEIVFEPIYSVDFDISWQQMSKENLTEITRYATFWGKGLEEPTFVLRDVPVKKDDIVVGGEFDNHKITFSAGGLEFIKFKGVSTETAQKLMKNQQSKIDVVGTIKMSTFRGRTFLQMFVADLELKSAQKYIF